MNKTTTIVILALIAFFACKKDNPEPEINEANYSTFDGSIWRNDNSTIVSSDNNLIICGIANYDNYWTLIKTTKSGQELWRSDFPSDDSWNNGCALAEAEGGNLFICGITHRNNHISGVDILLVKTNPNGDTLWTKTYGKSEYDWCSGIIETSDDHILISGGTEVNDSIPTVDIYLLKLDYNGDTLWTKTYSNPLQQGAGHLLETQNGEYLITGTSQDNDNPQELYLLKVDANGAILWDRKFSSQTKKKGNSTIELSNTDLVICGYHSGETVGNKQVLVIKTDNQGNTIWEQEYGENNSSEIGNSIKQNSDGSYTLTGSSRDIDTAYDDIILLKIDQSGNQVWFKKFGGTKTDIGRNLIKDTNDDNLITGNVGWAGPIFLTRTDKDGNFK